MATFGVGAVLHWEKFEFEDGTTQDKFFVVLGAKPNHDCLLVIATSQRRRRSYQAGCHAKESYFHIPGGRKDFFRDDTWLLLMECKTLRLAEVVKLARNETLETVATLREQLANAIRNCLKRSEDVSQVQLSLL